MPRGTASLTSLLEDIPRNREMRLLLYRMNVVIDTTMANNEYPGHYVGTTIALKLTTESFSSTTRLENISSRHA